MVGKMEFMPKVNSSKLFIILIVLSLLGILHQPMRVWPQANTPDACGDGFCSMDETCKNCPADCREPLTFLSAYGQRINNKNGHWINLRGFQFDCFSVFPKDVYDALNARSSDPYQLNADFSRYFCSDGDIREIKDMGSNVVKIGFRLWDIEEDPTIYGRDPNGSIKYSQTALDHLEDIINRFGRNGIYVILALQDAGQNPSILENEYGNILWDDPNLQDRVFDLWNTIAARFKDNSFVAGYDIINMPEAPDSDDPQPHLKNPKEDQKYSPKLHEFYQKTIQRIREQDKRHILFIESRFYKPWDLISVAKDYDDENIAYCIHYYGHDQALHWPFTLQGMFGYPCGREYPDYNYGKWEILWNYFFPKFLLNLRYMRDRPIFAGGFSASIWNCEGQRDDALQWDTDIMATFNFLNIHYTFNSYKSVISPLTYNNAFYRPRDDISSRIDSFITKLIQNEPIENLNEQKGLYSTKNFESPQGLKKVLVDGLGRSFCAKNNCGSCDDPNCKPCDIGICNEGEEGENCFETCQSCSNTCGEVCGNGICEEGENVETCSLDCLAKGFKGDNFGICSPWFSPSGTRGFEELGIEIIRFDIWWHIAEPERGKYNWTYIDNFFKRLDSSNSDVSVLFLLWASSYLDLKHKACLEESMIKRGLPDHTVTSSVPEDPNDFLNFLEELINRYKGRVKYWQFGNEVSNGQRLELTNDPHSECYGIPYINDFWIGTEQEYVDLLKLTYKKIKEMDPNAMVLASSFYRYEPNEFNDLIIEPDPNGEVYYDVIDIHLYDCPEDNTEKDIKRIKRKINALDFKRPISIWCSEHGEIVDYWHADTNFYITFDSPKELRLQAEEIIKRKVLAFSSGIEKMFTFIINPVEWTPLSPLEVFSHTALTFDFLGTQKKPGFYTTKLMIKKLKDFVSVAKIDYGIYRFTFSHKAPVYVMWVDGGEKRIDLSDHMCSSSGQTRKVRITYLVTELNDEGDSIYLDTDIIAADRILITKTPIFVEEIKELYVDDDFSDEDTDGSYHFRYIQDAIDSTCDGDAVIVHPGTYYEQINFLGKAITLRSLDPNKPDMVANTVIDGNGISSVITFENKEGKDSILNGFTIKNGSGVNGGGISFNQSSPSIINCIIAHNEAVSGGGICCDNNSFPDIKKCLIHDNSSSGSGGGIYCIDHSSPTITNCIISGNSAPTGGGIHCLLSSSPVITNCTVTANTSSGDYPGSIHTDQNSSPVICNCILWNNLPSGIRDGLNNVTYSDIQGGYGDPGITHNIDADPLFINPAGSNYHLDPNSPCIDKGINPGAPAEDMDGNTRPQDGDKDYVYICDMGAYEVPGCPFTTYYQDTDGDGYGNPDVIEIGYYTLDGINGFVWNANDCNDQNPNVSPGALEVLYDHIDNNCNGMVDEGSVPFIFYVDVNNPDSDDTDGDENFRHIQSAINDAIHRNIIIVNPGAYVENINFLGKSITLRSKDPNDPGFVSATIIDGNQEADIDNDQSLNVVTFNSEEDANSVISGITIQNGDRGIYCHNSSPTITDCVITDNHPKAKGGGIYCLDASPIIINCTISKNWAEDIFNDTNAHIDPNIIYQYDLNESAQSQGGGIHCTSSTKPGSTKPTISNCIITKNVSKYGGGISCYQSSPIINKGTSIYNNFAHRGGGICGWESSITINDCNIDENNTKGIGANGGGMYFHVSSANIGNCTIKENKMNGFGSNGGGVYLYQCKEININSCTVGQNQGGAYGGGIYCFMSTVSPSIINCIFGGNEAWQGGAIYSSYSSPLITNCTFSRNTATDPNNGGGGVYCYYSSPSIANCILWADTPNEIFIEPNEIWIQDSPYITSITYSDLQGGYGDPNNIIHNIKADPMFNLYPLDGHLLPGSPCIDSGTSNGAPLTDKSGHARPVGSGHDMGAYEDTHIWPCFRHDLRHTGRSPYVGAQTNILKWQIGGDTESTSSLTIGPDGTAYIGYGNNNIYALVNDPDPNIKVKVKWGFTTQGKIISSPAIGREGRIYFGSQDNNIYALDPNGNMIWCHQTGGFVNSSPVIGPDGAIYTGSHDGRLYAIDPDAIDTHKRVKWSYQTLSGIFSSPALGEDGTIYVGSYDDYFYAINPNGGLKWSYKTGGDVLSSPAIGPDGTIYVGSYDSNLYAFDSNGNLKWTCPLGGEILSSPAIGIDGTVYIGSFDDNIYAIDPNGHPKWSYKTGDDVKSSPAIGADGIIYIGSKDTYVYALDPNGKLKWRYKTDAPVGASSSIGADGTVYIASRDGVVYAFSPPSPILSVTPNGKADLGTVPIGDSFDMTFIVKNTGEGILSGNALTLPPFYIISGNSYELDPNRSQEVVVRFSPDEATYYNEDLVFSRGGGATRKLIGQGLSTCTYQIFPESKALNCSGGMGSIELTTQNGCSWTAVSNCDWIKITSDDSGDGSGLLHYRVSPNPGDIHREGTITIAGQTFTVHQAKAYPAKLTITPIDKVVNSQAGEITFVVNNTGIGTMDWTGLVIEGDWLQIIYGASGTNSGTIKVSYTENNGGERIGKIEVAGSDSIGCSKVEGSPATIIITQTVSGITCYSDYDEDGYGDPNHSIQSPSCPEGYIDNNLDCNDKDDTINPETQEICDDNVDNDCDKQKDEGCEKCIFTADITATGQSITGLEDNISTVSIGIDTDALTEEAPPTPPDNTVVLTLAGGVYDLKKDIRAAGTEREEWQLNVAVGGPGSVADPNKPGFFPVLSWDTNTLCPPGQDTGYIELLSENSQGVKTLLIPDMTQANQYQTKKEDGDCGGKICSFTYYIIWSNIQVEMNFSTGWSMMSLPLILQNPTPSQIFPEAAVIYAYKKGAGYVRIENNEKMRVGSGYWILFNEGQHYVFRGQPINSYSITVNESGWEMIGGCTSGVRPTADICVMGVIYRYTKGTGYQRVSDKEDLNPGEGFWILLKGVTDQCQLTVQP